MEVQRVILEGKNIRLEPLKIEHTAALAEFAFNVELWRWTANLMGSADDLNRYIDQALADQHRGVSLPFVTIDSDSGKILGSSRFGNIDTGNRRAEIGWTWIDPRWQRTLVNTEAKLLMLTHAFETWKCIRVEFKTDSLNVRSRNAIRRIGAVEEGILRNHMITESGRFRDSVYFSIIECEWGDIKQNLLKMLETR